MNFRFDNGGATFRLGPLGLLLRTSERGRDPSQPCGNCRHLLGAAVGHNDTPPPAPPPLAVLPRYALRQERPEQGKVHGYQHPLGEPPT